MTINGKSNTPTAAEMLKRYVERIETLEDERIDLADDIKAVYAEAKGEGFDPKIVRKVIARRKKPEDTREQDELILLYEGTIDGMPRIPRRDVRQLDIEEHLASGRSAEPA